MRNKILHIAYAKSKNEKLTIVNQAYLEKECGLINDYHALKKDGLIVIVSKSLLSWMLHNEKQGLCFKKFKYNICFDNDIDNFQSGQLFSLGQSILEITQRRKVCFANKQFCPIPPSPCLLLSQMRFVKIIQSGYIHVSNSLFLQLYKKIP